MPTPILSEGSRYVVVASPGPAGPEGAGGPAGPPGVTGVPGGEGPWRQTTAFQIYDIHVGAVTRGWWLPGGAKIVSDVFADVDQALASPVTWTMEYWSAGAWISIFPSPPTLAANTFQMTATPNILALGGGAATLVRLRIVSTTTTMHATIRGVQTYSSGSADVTSFTYSYVPSIQPGDSMLVIMATTDGASVTPPPGTDFTLLATSTSAQGAAVCTVHEFRGTYVAGMSTDWTTSAPCAVAATMWTTAPLPVTYRYSDADGVEFELNRIVAWPHGTTPGTGVTWHAAAVPAGLLSDPGIVYNHLFTTTRTASTSRVGKPNAYLHAGSTVVEDATPDVVASYTAPLNEPRRGWVTGVDVLAAPVPQAMAASFMSQMTVEQPVP